jgi:hypothetical protein
MPRSGHVLPSIILTVGTAGFGAAARGGEAARVVADAAEEVAPLIKMGASGGATAGKAFPKAVRDAAFAGNPEQLSITVPTCSARWSIGMTGVTEDTRVRRGTSTVDRLDHRGSRCAGDGGKRQ